MIEYTVSKDVRALMAAHEMRVRAALYYIANERFGTKITDPCGIDDPNGGIVVCGRRVVIEANRIISEKTDTHTGETIEEKAVLNAIQEVVKILEEDDMEALAFYGQTEKGSPLHALVSGITVQSISPAQSPRACHPAPP